MSDAPDDSSEILTPDGVADGSDGDGGDGGDGAEEPVAVPEPVAAQQPQPSITEPAKVMRIGAMVKQLLEEVRAADLDEASRERLAEVYERSVTELAGALSDDLQEELRGLALPFEHEDVPSEAELRVAKAQLVGWLEGLFHGIQASLMAQQHAAQQQLQQMRQLPGDPAAGGARGPATPPQAGTYL